MFLILGETARPGYVIAGPESGPSLRNVLRQNPDVIVPQGSGWEPGACMLQCP